MEKIKIIRLCSIFIVCLGLLGMFVFSDVYDDTKANIVDVLCLSCLKLQPKTSSDFIFRVGASKYIITFRQKMTWNFRLKGKCSRIRLSRLKSTSFFTL